MLPGRTRPCLQNSRVTDLPSGPALRSPSLVCVSRLDRIGSVDWGSLAGLLAALFLRGVGIVGVKKHAEDASELTITEQHAAAAEV